MGQGVVTWQRHCLWTMAAVPMSTDEAVSVLPTAVACLEETVAHFTKGKRRLQAEEALPHL